ncbi:putative Major outer membrane lipoprotein [Gammaproteobacteria bacterium]
MQKTIVKFAKYSALAVVVGLASGCASTESVKMAEEKAAEASTSASQALKAANEASRKADAAMSAARAAQECCDQTKEGINRSYKKSMNK